MMSVKDKMEYSQGDPLKNQYEQLWAGSYRDRPRKHKTRYHRFMGIVDPEEKSSIIDWGCGQGHLGKELMIRGHDVQLVDIASNCLDPIVEKGVESGKLKFINESISQADPFPADYSACMDVLEHLSPSQVLPALDNIISHTRKEAYFLVALHEDTKTFDGTEYILHLTVKSIEWWFKLFEKFGVLSHRCFWLDKYGHPMAEAKVRL